MAENYYICAYDENFTQIKFIRQEFSDRSGAMSTFKRNYDSESSDVFAQSDLIQLIGQSKFQELLHRYHNLNNDGYSK